MLLEMIFLVGPLAIGLVQVFAKFDAIDQGTQNFHDWLVRRNRDFLTGNGKFDKIARQTLVPWNTLFITVHDLTDDIRNWGLQSGIRLTSYIYIYTFLLLILVTIGKGLFIIALIGNVLFAILLLLRKTSDDSLRQQIGPKVNIGLDDEKSSGFVTKYYPFFVAENNRNKVGQLLNVDKIEVDYQGKIFTTDNQYFGRTKIGYVDGTGNIYDMREKKPLRIGWVDTRGNIEGLEASQYLLEKHF